MKICVKIIGTLSQILALAPLHKRTLHIFVFELSQELLQLVLRLWTQLLLLLFVQLLLLLLLEQQLSILRNILDVAVLVQLRTGQRRGALPLLVGAHVLAQVVRPGEPLPAAGAGEPLLAGVRAQMALQLVGARERLAAEGPGAGEGPLPGVPAQVRLQVRGLAVHLAAAGHVTLMLAPPFTSRAAAPVIAALAAGCLVLAVGTLALPAPAPAHVSRAVAARVL